MGSVRRKWEPSKARAAIGKALTSIEQLAIDLHWQAEASPNARDYPGGRALNMLAPAANLHDWQAQYDQLEEAALDEGHPFTRRTDPAVDQEAAEEQPLNVLTFWTRVIREERDQPTELTPTISREVDYLRKSLDWMTRVDEYDEPEWFEVTEVEADLRTLVRRMEDVLLAGERPEVSNVRCINDDCTWRPRLIKVYRSRAAWDYYRCPSCRTTYDRRQYLQAKAQNLHTDGSEKFILATTATEAAGVPIQTMRSWMRRNLVATLCDAETRRLMVWWPDVRDLMTRRGRNVS